MVIQGEYGQMDSDGKLLDNEPKAYVLNSYMQFNTFNLLVLFMDYDIDFDNPYQRSFSEYKRYKSTIFEERYWLEDFPFTIIYILLMLSLKLKEVFTFSQGINFMKI